MLADPVLVGNSLDGLYGNSDRNRSLHHIVCTYEVIQGIMFRFLAELIGSLIVCIVLWVIAVFMMKLAINAVVDFVLWTAEVIGMEYK